MTKKKKKEIGKYSHSFSAYIFDFINSNRRNCDDYIR